MKKFFYCIMAMSMVVSLSNAQSFTNSTSLLNNSYNSGGVVGVSDMDQDGLDDILILDQSRMVYIAYQEAGGTFTIESYGSVSGAQQWGGCIGDVDNDGHNDFFCGGSFDGTHFLQISSRGNGTLSDLDEGDLFMQGCNLADMNNDGWLDAFGCNDVAESRIWGNDGAGNLVPQNNWIDMVTTPSSDNSGNYGSVWSDVDNDGDVDLFIAKCRQGVGDPNDPRRINALFINDGSGNFTEEAAERGLVIYEQSWTSDFADIDNDGDFDCFITNHTNTLKILENDGRGYFTDITEGSGLDISGFFLQGKMVDFDNDGFVDLVYSGGLHQVFHNNGDNTFTAVPGMFPYSDTMHSFAIGDLNNDGSLDLYASYGQTYVGPDNNNPDILWMNDGNENNWIGFDLTGTVSNKNAVGARIEIYGDFGIQIREVRSGESYGIQNSFKANFGIGESTSVDLVVVRFPSGIVNVIENPTINTYSTVIESECDGPVAAAISTENGFSLCSGESLTMTTDAVSNFVWSNGSVEQEITTDEVGTYTVLTYSDGCGSLSESAIVEEIEIVTPELNIAGELTFCEGGEVTLIAPESSEYSWSTGSEVQAISVTESGTYSVSIDSGSCGMVSSDEVIIEVLDGPELPVVSDEVIGTPGEVTMMGDSENIYWYDSEVAVDPLSEGMSYTANINDNTTFYVESYIQHGGNIQNGGELDNDGEGAYQDNSTYFNVFDVHEDIIINSVKVYANGDGNRTLEIVNNFGTVVASGTFLIPDGESRVDVNFAVTEGNQYSFRTVGNPQLWRNSVGDNLNYPYEIGDLCSITGTNITGNNEFNYYYYFYDWEVQTESTICVSDRIPVSASIVGIEEIEGLSAFTIYPNPVNDELNLNFALTRSSVMSLSIVDGTGRIVLNKDFGTQSSGAHVERVDVNQLASGIYLINLSVDGKFATERIVVE